MCLPRGHVRRHENLTDAVKREMSEELGIEVKEFRFVCKNRYVASNGEKQNTYCYLIENYSGELVWKSTQEIY